MLTILSKVDSATSLVVDDSRSCLWFAQADGSLNSVPIDGGAPTTHQTAAVRVVGMGGNHSVLVLAHGDGTVSVVDPDDPAGPMATVTSTKSALGQTALSGAASPTAALVSRSRRLGRIPDPELVTSLMTVKIQTAGARSRQVAGLAGVAIDGRATYVSTNQPSGGPGALASLKGGLHRSIATGLPRVGRLGVAQSGEVILVCHPSSARLSGIQPATGAVETVSTASLQGTVVEAHGLGDGRIAVLTTDVLVILDSLADLANEPTVEPFAAPLFVGSWTKVQFDLGDSGLGAADVQFVVPEGPDAGFVSYARQDGVSDPVPLLVAGGQTGPHALELREVATANVLATAQFEISDHWPDAETGPPGVYMTESSFGGDSGWGGGPNTPQNVGVHPHIGTWRSMVLMVDTSSGRWPTDATTMSNNRTAILGHVVNGITFNGDVRSARHYYEENSRYTAPSGGNPARGLTVSARNNQTFGPVSLPNTWTDYFAQGTDAAGAVTDERWSPKGSTLQTIISRSISDGVCTTADYSDIDVLIMVICSPDATGGPPARFAWPYADDATEFLCGTNAVTDRRSFGWTVVPLDFAAHDGRQMHTTLSHELGHTLSLPDLYDFPAYPDDITNRLTYDWDMMAGSRDALPHYSISNKMRMGWIPPSHIKLFNFQGSSAVNQDVTVYAAELDAPPAGQFKTIEIRLGNGWNYYVEYRAEQPAQISDDVPTDRRVLITDVTSASFVPSNARPPIVLVRSDIDGDGPILGTGADLEEKDPGTQMDLVVRVTSTAADNAVVNISYGSNGRPEPGIRPWNGGPTWQSPDIEVRNDRSAADPGNWFNTPWPGRDNTIVAKVKNSGDLPASGVVVDFYVTEYTAGDGPWFNLGMDTRNVPEGSTVEFTRPWNPPAEGHYCVIVRIRLYQDPANLTIFDQNIYNNEARSNYTRFVSGSSSPSSRVGASVLLANPFPDSTHVFARVKQTHGQHRVFTDHQWLRVPGAGSRPIQVWDEALWGTPEWHLVVTDRERRDPEYLWKQPNQVSVEGRAERPFETDCGALTLTGGVGMEVAAGRTTRIDLREVYSRYVAGRVLFEDDGSAVRGGKILVEVTADDGQSFTVDGEIGQDGAFSIEFHNPLEDAARWLEVHFLGAFSATPSSTGRVALPER